MEIIDENNISENVSENVILNSKSNTNSIVSIEKPELLKSLVPIILRQTDYTEEVAAAKLEQHNFNLKAVLYEWIGCPLIKKEIVCKTSNQERYRLIRQTMDIN